MVTTSSAVPLLRRKIKRERYPFMCPEYVRVAVEQLSSND